MNESAAIPETAPSAFEIYRTKGTTPEIRLMVQVVLAGRRWRSVLDEHLRRMGQSSARLEALAAIINSPAPSSQSDIARRLRIEGPTLTRMIDVLTADGLVERRPAPADRRTKHLHVTEKGEQALEAMFAVVDPLRHRLVAHLSPGEIEQLAAMLGDLIGRLDGGLADTAGDRA